MKIAAGRGQQLASAGLLGSMGAWIEWLLRWRRRPRPDHTALVQMDLYIKIPRKP